MCASHLKPGGKAKGLKMPGFLKASENILYACVYIHIYVDVCIYTLINQNAELYWYPSL